MLCIYRVVVEDLKKNLKHGKNVAVLCADYSNIEEGREKEISRGRGIADEREVVRAALESGCSLVPCHSFGDSHAFGSSPSLPSLPSSSNHSLHPSLPHSLPHSSPDFLTPLLPPTLPSSPPLSLPNNENENENESTSVFTSFLPDFHKLKNLFFGCSGRYYLPVPYR